MTESRMPLPWWSLPLWWLVALLLLAAFVLGEVIVAIVFTIASYEGSVMDTSQFNAPAGGFGLGVFLMVVASIVEERRESFWRRGRDRGAVTHWTMAGIAAIAAVSWLVAAIALVVNRWPDMLSTPHGMAASPVVWPAFVGVLAFLVAGIANAFFVRRVIRRAVSARQTDEPVGRHSRTAA